MDVITSKRISDFSPQRSPDSERHPAAAVVVPSNPATEPEPMAKQPKKLGELFHDTLKDIYYAEKKILSALPKMARAASNDELRAAFEKHHDETEGQISRLEQVFEAIDAK